jgi:two-component system response regulator AtoC
MMTEQPPRRRVLFIEDEPALRISYERFFRPRYAMAFASSGAEALARLEETPPDVVVLDLRLPDTDGVELLRRLREKRPDLPVIITTAYVSVEPQLRVLDLAHSAYLIKPFDLDELGDAIDRAG